MDALLIIAMQVGLLAGGPKLDLPGVVARINRLASAIRNRSGRVVWIQHAGQAGDPFAPGASSWGLLPEMDRHRPDDVVSKSLNDPFAHTKLPALPKEIDPGRVLVCGWATDFCVDAAVRSAVSAGFDVVAVEDAHTVSDRPHMDAASVIRHYNWLWANLIPSRSVAVLRTDELIA